MRTFYRFVLAVVTAAWFTAGGKAEEPVAGPQTPAAAPAAAPSAPSAEKPADAPASGAETVAATVIKEKGATIDLDGKGHVLAIEWAGAKLDDEALASLANLPALESLDLGESRVTEAGLARLRRLTGLKRPVLCTTCPSSTMPW